MLKRRLFYLCGLLLIGSSSAQSLNAFYEHALKNDLLYQHAYHQYLAELKNPKIVRSSAYPQLSGQASGFMSRQWKPTHDSYPGYSVQLNLKQILLDGQLSAKIDQADWQAKLSQVQWASVQQSLMLRSATTYLQLLKNIEVYQSAKAQEKALKSLLTSVRHQYQLNTITKDDYWMVKAQAEQAIAQTLQAHYQVALAKEAMVVMGGSISGPFHQLSDQLVLSLPKPNKLGNWIDLGLKHNLDLQAIGFQEKMSLANLRQAQRGHLPSFAITGQFARNYISHNALANQSALQVGVTMNLPIYQGGQVSYKTDQANAAYQAIQAQHKLVHRQVKQAVHQAFYAISVGLAQLKALHTASQANAQALKSMTNAYHLGMKTTADYLKQIHEQYESFSQYRQARYDYLLAILQLKQSVGLLSESDIDQVSRLLSQKLK